jgi:hypothetical protein
VHTTRATVTRGVTVALFVLRAPVLADGAVDLFRRLDQLRSPDPITATLHLELHVERTLHHKSVTGQATVQIEVDDEAGGLRVRWDPAFLREADAEESRGETASLSVAPWREALKALDPARLAHLLDQAHTLASLTAGEPREETPTEYDGRPARRLVYRFKPRLSWVEADHLIASDGRFTVWVDAEGTPMASESVATFDGKTSRLFGRYRGATTVRTRYALEGGRLRVAEREVDDLRSRQDGDEVEHVRQRFVVDRVPSPAAASTGG